MFGKTIRSFFIIRSVSKYKNCLFEIVKYDEGFCKSCTDKSFGLVLDVKYTGIYNQLDCASNKKWVF